MSGWNQICHLSSEYHLWASFVDPVVRHLCTSVRPADDNGGLIKQELCLYQFACKRMSCHQIRSEHKEHGKISLQLQFKHAGVTPALYRRFFLLYFTPHQCSHEFCVNSTNCRQMKTYMFDDKEKPEIYWWNFQASATKHGTFYHLIATCTTWKMKSWAKRGQPRSE